MNTNTKLEQIKGVGPKTAEQFALAGLQTVGDLITFLPRKHEDFSAVSNIADISPGKRTVKACVEQVAIKRVRRGMTITTAVLADDSGRLNAVWFNQPYRQTQFKDSAQEFYFSGDFEFSYNKYQLTNPSAEKVSDLPVQTDRILPVYPAIKGLKSQLVRKVLAELRPLMTMLPENLPQQLVAEQQLVSHSQALLGMHFPKTAGDVEDARRRLGFEELFNLVLAAQLNRRENTALKGWQISFAAPQVKRFVESLPFALTADQKKAAWSILQDFEKPTPMNRLLQGDVGSGKTVVAGLAAFQAARAGFQTAFLAPTEILAIQHAETLQRLLEPFGVQAALLTGGVKGARRNELLKQLKEGEVDVVVGTHALLEPPVHFAKLGFVVIDEQHRFGVAQRQALLTKSPRLPHLLAMTATPIPRSLQLTVFGELDISIIAEKPSNRLPIKTKIWSPVSRNQLYAAIDTEIEKGRQVYVICRLIDENPSNDAKSVQAEHKKLQNSLFAHRRIGLLHGKMKSNEKQAVMSDFAGQKLDILVSTTVVEVGVDVPNATVMLVEDADLYGLSQLHQLRGRVGRSAHQSYCFLLTSDTKKPSQRLKEIERSNDGFYLAEVDLKLRGPGEVYGRAQHGALNLRIANLADTKLIEQAQSAAKWFVSSGQNLLEYKQLADEVERYQRLTTLN